MAEPLPPLQDPLHASAWAMAYLDGTLSDADRARFEEHMKAHAECREHMETMRAALPALVRVLMEDGPPRTGAELAELAKAAEERRRAKQERSPHAALSPGRGEGGGRKWLPAWLWGGGFAGLAAAAASVLVFLQPFTAGMEPQLFHAVDMAPIDDSQAHPVWPDAVKIEVAANVRFGRLVLRVPRRADETYLAVVLIDSAKKKWLVQTGEQQSEPLELRVELNKLAPGAFDVAVLVSPRRISAGGLTEWLREPTAAPSGWLGASGYALVAIQR
jgi:anti-sigma factor RsiW